MKRHLLALSLISSVLAFYSVKGAAKQVVKGETAELMYQDFEQQRAQEPEKVVASTTMYFADWERPELGRLWLTTIYRRDDLKRFCYEYDFREKSVKEYLCEIY